jgi:hypothetical protein
MPLSNQRKMTFLNTLELISTAVFLGTVSVGFGSIVTLVFYNMAHVLLYEARHFPVFAALYLFAAILGVLFLVGQMADPAEKDEEGVAPHAPPQDTDPIHFEEDPSPQ